MTCAACHTGQLEYRKDGVTHVMRLDGAPANADFQEFLADLIAAARATLMQPDRFNTFARAGPPRRLFGRQRGPTQGRLRRLGQAVRGSHGHEPAGVAVGTGAGRCIRSDHQSRGGPHFRHPGQFQGRRRAGQLSVPMERVAAGSHAVERQLPQRPLYSGACAQYRPSAWGFRQVQAGADRSQHPAQFPRSSATARIQRNSTAAKLEEKIAVAPSAMAKSDFRVRRDSQAGQTLFEAHCSSCHAEQPSLMPGAWPTPVKAVGTDPKMALDSARMFDLECSRAR